MRRLSIIAAAAAFAVAGSPSVAVADHGCHTKKCEQRAKLRCMMSKGCLARVKAKQRAKVRRAHARALAREMRGYRRHPMPSCTWVGESSPPGDYSREWPPSSRYTAKNPNSTASGKFQILTSTWLANGGGAYASEARWAKPVYQERVARRVARAGISSQWVNC